jgi:hypothetical protein
MLAECSCSHESWQATKPGQGKIRAISLSESPARTISVGKKDQIARAFGRRATVSGRGARPRSLSSRGTGFSAWEGAGVGRRLRGRLVSVHAADAWATKIHAGLSVGALTPRRRLDRLARRRDPNMAAEKVPSTVCLRCSCTPSAYNYGAPMFEFRPMRQDVDSSNVAKLAIKAGVAICLCMVASEWLANAAQRGDLPRVALVWPESEPWRGVKARLSPQAAGSATVYRNIGVDGVTTSTIPTIYKRPAVISPCGDGSPLGVKDLPP